MERYDYYLLGEERLKDILKALNTGNLEDSGKGFTVVKDWYEFEIFIHEVPTLDEGPKLCYFCNIKLDNGDYVIYHQKDRIFECYSLEFNKVISLIKDFDNSEIVRLKYFFRLTILEDIGRGKYLDGKSEDLCKLVKGNGNFKVLSFYRRFGEDAVEDRLCDYVYTNCREYLDIFETEKFRIFSILDLDIKDLVENAPDEFKEQLNFLQSDKVRKCNYCNTVVVNTNSVHYVGEYSLSKVTICPECLDIYDFAMKNYWANQVTYNNDLALLYARNYIIEKYNKLGLMKRVRI